MDSDGDRWPCDGPDAHRNCGVAIRRAPVAKTYTHPTSGLGATTLLCNDKRILRPSLDFCSTSGITTLWSPQAVNFQHWKTRAVVIKSRHTGVVRANSTLTQLRGGLRRSEWRFMDRKRERYFTCRETGHETNLLGDTGCCDISCGRRHRANRRCPAGSARA